MTISVENVTARTILTAICESIACQYHVQEKTLIVQYAPDSMELTTGRKRTDGIYTRLPHGTKFIQTPVKNALATLEKLSGVEIVLPVDVTGIVTVDVSGQVAVQAVHNVMTAAGLIPGSYQIFSTIPVSGQSGSFPAQIVIGNVMRAPIRVSEVDQDKKLIKRIEPVYPENAQSIPVRGPVIIEAVVNDKGEVIEAKIVSGGNPVVQKPVLDAVKQSAVFTHNHRREAGVREVWHHRSGCF